MIQLPEFPCDDAGVRDLIISILCAYTLLSAKQIFAKIQRHGANCSYQAVHKQLVFLSQKKIVRKFNNKHYAINEEWLDFLEVFVYKTKESLRALKEFQSQNDELSERTLLVVQ